MKHVCREGWVCEAHPSLAWPHYAVAEEDRASDGSGDCIGPGMPCDHAIEAGCAPGPGPDCEGKDEPMWDRVLARV